MNPMDKQLERVPANIRDKMPREQLITVLESVNAMRSAMNVGGQSAVKKWAKRNLTVEKRAALDAIKQVDGELKWLVTSLLTLVDS
jgi:hypothetical protein